MLNLPTEILLKIFHKLPPKHVQGTCRHVCHRFNGIIEHYFELIEHVNLNITEYPNCFEVVQDYLNFHFASNIISLRIISGQRRDCDERGFLRLLRHCSVTLKSLSMSDNLWWSVQFREDLAEVLAQMTNLEFLDLAFDRFLTDYERKILEAVEGLDKLKTIKLVRCDAESLQCLLKRCSKSLQVLKITSYFSSDNDIDIVRNLDMDLLARVVHVNQVRAKRLSPGFWQLVSKLANVDELHIVGPDALRTAVESFYACKRLKRKPDLSKVKTLVVSAMPWQKPGFVKYQAFWSLFSHIQALELVIHGKTIPEMLEYYSHLPLLFPKLQNLHLTYLTSSQSLDLDDEATEHPGSTLPETSFVPSQNFDGALKTMTVRLEVVADEAENLKNFCQLVMSPCPDFSRLEWLSAHKTMKNMFIGRLKSYEKDCKERMAQTYIQTQNFTSSTRLMEYFNNNV